MYRSGILALLVTFAAAGWSEAQLPANLQLPSDNTSTVSLSTGQGPAMPLGGNLGLPANLQGRPYGNNLGVLTISPLGMQGTRYQNGNRLLPYTRRSRTFQQGNPGLPANLQGRPYGNNLGVLTISPLGMQGTRLPNGNVLLPSTPRTTGLRTANQAWSGMWR